MLGPAAEDNDDEPGRSVDMPRKSPVYKTPKTPVAVSPTDGTPHRKRGRPRKDATPAGDKTPKTHAVVTPTTQGTPRGRGRPRKVATPAEDNDDEPAAKRPRGRPRKSPVDKIENIPVSPKSPVDKIKNRLVSPKSPGDKTPKKTVVVSPTTQSPTTQSPPRGRGRPRKVATPAEDNDNEPAAKRPVGRPRKSPVVKTKTKTSAAGGKKKSSKSKTAQETERQIAKEVSNTAKQFAEWTKSFGF